MAKQRCKKAVQTIPGGFLFGTLRAGVSCLLLFSYLLPAQIFVKGDTSVHINGNALYADTIIYENDKDFHPTPVNNKTKIYIVKGTVTSNLTDHTDADLVYVHAYENRKEQKKPAQKTNNTAKNKVKAVDKTISQKQEKLFYKPYGNRDGGLYLQAGKNSVAVTADPSSAKKSGVSENFGSKIEFTGFLLYREIFSCEREIFISYTTFHTTRPPPSFLS